MRIGEGPKIECDSARVVRRKGVVLLLQEEDNPGGRLQGRTSTFYYCGRHPPSFYHRSKLMVHAASDQNKHTHTPISNIFVLVLQSKKEMIWLASSGEIL